MLAELRFHGSGSLIDGYDGDQGEYTLQQLLKSRGLQYKNVSR